jgi:hypothetical protein
MVTRWPWRYGRHTDLSPGTPVVAKATHASCIASETAAVSGGSSGGWPATPSGWAKRGASSAPCVAEP